LGWGLVIGRNVVGTHLTSGASGITPIAPAAILDERRLDWQLIEENLRNAQSGTSISDEMWPVLRLTAGRLE
jgi:hypothetical protein